MLRKVLFGSLAALAAGMVVYQGCSSDSGGGDGQQALSFDSDTALPANGGAAIAVAFGSRLAATMPTIFQALVDETATASSEVQRKQLQFGLALCDDGTAQIEVDEIPPTDGSAATVTFEGCTGSPLSSTAVNGQLVLSNISVGPATDAFNPISADGRFAGLPGSVDFAAFTIAGEPNDTVLTGVVSVRGDFDPIVAAPETIVMRLATQREDGGPVTISEGDRQLQLGCFDIDTTIDIGDKVCDEASDEAGDPCVADDDCTNGLCINEASAITVFKPRGVLSLFFDVEKAGVYTLNSVAVPPSPPVPNIGFPPGSSIPNSGSLTLHSGDQIGDGGCPAIKGGPFPGDGSTTTATFESEPEGMVTIEVQGLECFECETTWENLLNTLSDIAFPDSCDKVECGGTGGSGGTGGTSGAADVLTCAADALPDFKAYLDELIEVLKQVDSPGSDNDFLIDWTSDDEAGLFAIGLDLDGGGPERELSGFVTPKERCINGMETNDVCILKWTVNMRTPSAEEVAYGRISAVKFAPTAQNPTGAHRLTIIDFDPNDSTRTNIKVEHSVDCSIEANLFDMLWRLRTEPAEFYSLSLGFDITRLGAAQDSGRGDVIWGSGTGSEATITFTVDGKRVDCDFDLDTFEVVC